MDCLADAAAALSSTMTDVASRPVTYARGAQSVALSASVGRTPFELIVGQGLTVNAVARDYLFAAADLVLGGEEARPQDGDQVTEADGSVFEVIGLDRGMPCWRWSDPFGTRLRVHTKLVGRAPAD